MPIIEVERLVKRYNGMTAVNDLSFAVEPGELFAFLGPNGAGKTTTINILCTLLAPTSGATRVAGFDCLRQPTEVRARIGIIFQDPSLDERLTAWENLLFHAMIYHVPARERRDRIERVLAMVELSDWRRTIVKRFSGGMKRRLEIARGLLHRPTVLFLDEPTIGLDPQTRRRLWAFMARLRQESQITIFLTTHYLEEAEVCDRVAIMDHGRLVALDTPAVLKQRYATAAASLEDVFLQLTGHDLRDEGSLNDNPLKTVRRWNRFLR